MLPKLKTLIQDWALGWGFFVVLVFLLGLVLCLGVGGVFFVY